MFDFKTAKISIKSLYLCFSLILILAIPYVSYATKPCMFLAKNEFVEQVVKPSDLIVIGEIVDYSSYLEKELDKERTDIKIIEIVATKESEHDLSRIRIKGWQAHDLPLYDHKIKDKMVFFLKKEKDNYVLTNKDWGSCVPSIIEIQDDTIYDSYGFINEKNRVELNKFKTEIKESFLSKQ